MIDHDEDEYMPYGRLMELAAQVAFVVLLGGVLYGAHAFGADKPPPPPDCWPWWQCNGSKETNHPNCKCWDNK